MLEKKKRVNGLEKGRKQKKKTHTHMKQHGGMKIRRKAPLLKSNGKGSSAIKRRRRRFAGGSSERPEKYRGSLLRKKYVRKLSMDTCVGHFHNTKIGPDAYVVDPLYGDTLVPCSANRMPPTSAKFRVVPVISFFPSV